MLSSMSKYRPWCSTGSVLPTHCCSCRRDQRSVRPPSWVWRDTLSEYRPLGSFSLTALKHKTSTSMGSGVRIHSTYTGVWNISLCEKDLKRVREKTLQKVLFISFSHSFVLNIYTEFVNICECYQFMHSAELRCIEISFGRRSWLPESNSNIIMNWVFFILRGYTETIIRKEYWLTVY